MSFKKAAAKAKGKSPFPMDGFDKSGDKAAKKVGKSNFKKAAAKAKSKCGGKKC